MDPTARRLRFPPGWLPVVGVVAFVSLVAAASAVAHLRLLGPDPATYPPHVEAVLSLPFSSVVFLGTWVVLRYEGVSAPEVGLGKSNLLPGVVAFGGLWAVVAAAGGAYLVVTGDTGGFGASFEMPIQWVPVWFLLMLTVSNGLTEEFVFRGYLQSKCTALATARSRVPPAAVGVVAAALLFGVVHVPLGMIVYGASVRAVPWILLNNLIPGVAYGLVYYLTQNLWYTGFVHGFANATVLPFDPSAVPLLLPAATAVAVLIALGYRSWARTTKRVTAVRRKEVESVD